MSDKFGVHPTQLNSPAVSAFSIAPDDANDLAEFTRGLNVATTGVVRVTMVSDQVVDLYVAAGVVFPARVKRVHATGTTAAGIVGLL